MAKPGRTDRGWTFLDHTADIRMEARGETLEDLFANAALGLTSLLASEPAGPADTEIDVVLEGADYEQLIVDWLREILFHYHVRGFILVQPHLTGLSENRIEARLSGITARDEQALPGMEIKAVTYHGLSIQKTDEGYCARILFDV